MDWRAFFPDAKLQALIDTALARNTDLANAKLEVDEGRSLPQGGQAGIPAFRLVRPFRHL
jgi:outer membrane protein TolC